MVSPSDLRASFETRLKQGIPIPPGEFHPSDLERIKDNKYLNRVLENCKNDLQRSSKMLWNIMKWRKTVGASDINESIIRMDYVEEGVIFPHGRDKDGCKLIIVKVKRHTKGQKNFEEIKKIVIYWFDRVEREEDGNKVTFFFDMDGCGLSNMDIEFIKFFISLSNYYPAFVNSIAVYQLPWMLTAAFKVIRLTLILKLFPLKVVRSLLPPEAVGLLKLVDRSNVLKEIVYPDQALVCWGGKDDYVFKFVPEKPAKRVSFAASVRLDNEKTTNPTISINPTGEMLHLEPNDKIIFKIEEEELVGRFTITNLEEHNAHFKIRTTSPEKFIVEPSSGVIEPKTSNSVAVTVLQGYQKTVGKEKFLVISTLVPNIELSKIELSKLWKSASRFDEYKLRCHVLNNIEDNNNLNSAIINNNIIAEKADLVNSIKDLKVELNAIRNQMVRIKVYQLLILILLFVSSFLTYFVYKNMGVG